MFNRFTAFSFARKRVCMGSNEFVINLIEMCHRDVVREQVKRSHILQIHFRACDAISSLLSNVQRPQCGHSTFALTWTLRNCASFDTVCRAFRIFEWQKRLYVLVCRQFEVWRIATEMCVRRWWMFKIQHVKLCAKIENKIRSFFRCFFFFAFVQV